MNLTLEDTDKKEKHIIRIISKIAGVNYIAARHMLEKDSVCILKAKAIEIKKQLLIWKLQIFLLK